MSCSNWLHSHGKYPNTGLSGINIIATAINTSIVISEASLFEELKFITYNIYYDSSFV
jgi:hypothetical protein